MKVYLKTEDEIELMRQANQLVGKTLAELAKHIVPGVTTLQLDRIADEFIRDHGAIPTFKNFPNPFWRAVSREHLHLGKRGSGAWRA